MIHKSGEIIDRPGIIESGEIKDRPGIIEIMLIISVSLMPYTELKVFGPVGPSELLVFVAFLYELFCSRLVIRFNRTFISKYFSLYILFAAFGTAWNFIRFILGMGLSSTVSSIAFDFFSYLFILMTLFSFEMHFENPKRKIDAMKLLEYIVKMNCVLFPVLFVIGKYRTSIFGMKLFYYEFFTPLASNPHHTSMYLLPLSFLTIFIAENTDAKLIIKILYYAFAVFFMYLAYGTGAAKAMMGIVLGVIICAFYKINTIKGVLNNNTKKIFWLLFFVDMFLIILNINAVETFLVDYFRENDNHGAREDIWTRGINRWLESPLIGFGFGSQIRDNYGYRDAHNTFITTLVQGGILAFSSFVILWIKNIKESVYNGYLLAANVSILVYVTGGDIMRRIPSWSFMIIIYLVIETQLVKNNIYKKELIKR